MDWATIVPGIPDKVYSQPNSGIGFACHSIVGSYAAAMGRFMSTLKDDDGRYTRYAAASCVFVLRYSGELIQMYPITASTWTSGGVEANCNYIPMELEGGQAPNYSEPMTDAQVASFVRLINDLEAHKGIQYIPNENILQHKQLAAMFGTSATACASDRYDNGWIALEETQVMTPEEVEAIVRKVFDESYASYYRTFTGAYWNSGYTDADGNPVAPDEAVVAAVTEAVINYTDEVISND